MLSQRIRRIILEQSDDPTPETMWSTYLQADPRLLSRYAEALREGTSPQRHKGPAALAAAEARRDAGHLLQPSEFLLCEIAARAGYPLELLADRRVRVLPRLEDRQQHQQG
jgi:hypothetical protein